MTYLLKTLWVFFILAASPLWAWNAAGHRYIAQIAYDNMTPEARERFSQYNHALDKVYAPLSFINAAVWLDTLRMEGIGWFDHFHYISLYFTDDNTLLPATAVPNGVWALNEALHILENPKSNEFEKGISLRIFLHVAGDLHQPLHAGSKVTAKYPDGDKGGNLFPLGENNVAANLHGYWDLGGGLLKSRRQNAKQIQKKAAQIENHWPCKRWSLEPKNWAQESNELAIQAAYQIQAGEIPSSKYQHSTQKISEQQIAKAGCRIASILNRVDEKLREETY